MTLKSKLKAFKKKQKDFEREMEFFESELQTICDKYNVTLWANQEAVWVTDDDDNDINKELFG